MGTSCRIGVLVDGRVKSNYIRYDGGLSGVGLRESCEYFYLFNGRWLVYHNDYEFLFESKKTNARTYLFTPLDNALKKFK